MACACKSTDARECFDARYPLPPMDPEREAERQNRIQDCEECECSCHEPDDNYDGPAENDDWDGPIAENH